MTNAPLKDRNGDIEEVIKINESLNEADIGQILLNVVNRRRFEYKVRDMIEYLGKFICLRKRGDKKEKFKKHEMFQRCEEKMEKELDIVNLLKQGRTTKLLTQTMLNQRQKLLLRFQRKYLIETSSSSEQSELESKNDTIRLMDCKNPLI